MKKNLYAIALSATIILLASCTGNKEQAPAAADNTPKYRAGVEVVFNAFATGNTDGIDSLIDANYVEHSPPPGIEVKGAEGFKKLIKMNHDGFPDNKLTIIDYIESGDMAVVHYNWTGTNTGNMEGMPATNKPFDINGMDLLKFANGKCIEHWGYFEVDKFMQQLGMMPPMPPMSGAPADSAKAK
ncbi:MAG: ester cyclase [Bacteroidia bacterium]